jgi:uncharacterized membrane protein YqjE
MTISARPPAAPLASSRVSSNGPEPSLGELLSDLSQDLTELVRQEAQLARTELHEKLSRITVDLASLAAGGVVAALGGLAVTAAIILFLVHPVGLSPWLAALVVAVVLGLAGFLMLRRGITDLKRTDPAPRRTLETIKDDIQWVKEHRP